MTMTTIIASVIALFVGIAIGWFIMRLAMKYRAQNIIKEAEAEAEVIKKDKILQAKEKFLQIKAEHEKQAAARNNKLLMAENKLKQQETDISRKLEEIQRKGKELQSQQSNIEVQKELIEKKTAELDKIKKQQIEQLEAISGMSGEQAKEKLINSVVMRTLNKMFLPYPVRVAITTVKSVKYIYQGVRTLMKGKLEVPVLDATAIGVSMLRGDFNTAGSTMFLLGIGEILEEWTHKKSVNDLARSMSINAEKVWFVNEDGQEVLISASSVKAGDLIRVHMGNVIPFDGNVAAGEAMVNQTSLTGESAPVRKAEGSFAYAGTVLEEGELTVKVKEAAGSSRYEKIVNMIEDSEKLKSSVESNAEHLADRLVPYTLAGTGITYLLTRNMTKTLAVLMVDFSCALKLAMPVSVLSAIREASTHSITVKGGKYMEAMADATTIVFDKTGTLIETDGSKEKSYNLPVYALGRWQKPGDRTDVPRFVLEQGAGPQNSSRYIHSTDHIRLKNLTLGFTLPGRWVQKALIENARVYFSGSNLLTWAKWKQYDPEVPVNGEVFCEAPPMRTFNFGVEITF